MKTTANQVLLPIAMFAMIGCAESNESSPVTPDKITTDTGVIEVGSGDTAGVDTAVPDTSVAPDVAGDGADSCAFPATETRPCGYCGTMTRTCSVTGTWTAFSECSGEISGAECKVGDKRESACGLCGKATDYCDPKTCAWTEGFCAGEGPCAEGDEETIKASCAVAGEVRTRRCDSKCQWSEYSECALPRGWFPMATAPIAGRGYHSAVWTGTDMVIWGGGSSSGSSLKNDGASYNLATNKWTTIATPSLAARRNHRTVWTGSKMMVWGGWDGSSNYYKDGAVYDPATDTWTAMAASPLTARHSSAAAWSTTTNELLVWGGCTAGSCTAVAGDGAIYNPATNTWSPMPAPPPGFVARSDASHTWSGSELIIWGGRRGDGTLPVDGARFDPLTRAWTTFSTPPSSVLDGRFDATYGSDGAGGLFVWGGRATTSSGVASGAKANGAVYTPSIGWVPIPAVTDKMFGGSGRRYDVAGFVAKGKLYLLNGIALTEGDWGLLGFVSYDFATGVWSTESTTGAPSPGTRGSHSVVWTGRELLFFGGINGHTCCTVYNNGGIYRP